MDNIGQGLISHIKLNGTVYNSIELTEDRLIQFLDELQMYFKQYGYD